ncbi:MAG: tRNA epoxyqueuosine(34) reductase QueG [Planctomycetota bacterium]
MGREQRAIEIAREIGFDLAGIAPLRPPADAERFDRWLAQGHHASMAYLERNRDRIVDPRRVEPTGRSLLVVGLAHARAPTALADGARVARYAAGRDYHNVMTRMLRKLAKRLDAEGLGAARGIVDAGPLLERSHAVEAGLGFASKAANLLHPRFGPWFFLGELILTVDLAPTEAPVNGSCGTCTACIDACPTGALVEPGVLDARKCISYQTIENRGAIPDDLRASIGGWVFGCDVCSEVCPWGSRTADFASRFGTHSAIADAGLVEWIELGDRFQAACEGSPVRRPGRAGLARNAAIVLGNQPSERGRRALLHALTFDPSVVVREASAWALSRAHGGDAGVKDQIARAGERETDAAAREAMARHLARTD